GCTALKESKAGARAFFITENVIYIGSDAFSGSGIEALVMSKSSDSGAWYAYDSDDTEITGDYGTPATNAGWLKGNGASYRYVWKEIFIP
ncbi:MAG: hypothetical protein ACI4U2_01605, partial [Christensenellaceae bacterium]